MTEEPVDFTGEYLRAIRAENEKTHRMLFEIVKRPRLNRAEGRLQSYRYCPYRRLSR